MRLQLSANPVLVKELRGRMRGPRAYLFLTATLALLGAVSYGLYRIALASAQSFGGGPVLLGGPAGSSNPPSFVIGQSVFIGLVFLALIVICAIAPSLTAGAISGEHERKTFDLLMATPLRPSSILFGKLAAALSYVVLILLAAVPLVSLSFVFGGVAMIDMIQALLLLLGYALTYSVIGLFFSALFRRSGQAVGASYLVLTLFVFGTMFVYIVLAVTRGRQPPHWLLSLNPFSAMASALVMPPSANTFVPPGLFSLNSILWAINGGGSLDPRIPLPTPLWRYTVGIYAWLTIVLYLVSVQLVKPVGRFRLRARQWLIVVLFLIASILAVAVIYRAPASEGPSFVAPTTAPAFIERPLPPLAPRVEPPVMVATPAPPPLTRTPTPTRRPYPLPTLTSTPVKR